MWTTITARSGVAVQRVARSAPGSAPWRQSPSSQTTSSPSRSAIARHSVAKWPVSEAITLVAGRERVDQRGLPRAGAGRGIDDDRAARSGRPAAGRRAPRGRAPRSPGRDGRSSARRSPAAPGRGRSSGPGICRKWRPGRYTRRFHTASEWGSARWSWRSSRTALRAGAGGRGARRRLHAAPVRGRREHVRASSRSRSRSRATPTTSPPRSRSPRASASRSSPRGGGTSLAGQAVGGRGLVLDTSRHMDAIGEIDADGAARARRAGRRAGGPQPRGRAARARRSGRTPRPRTGRRSAG